MIYTIVFGTSLLIGVAVGRWWALLAAPAAGAWIAVSTGMDEVPHWFLGIAYGLLTGAGVAAGVALRRSLRRPVR